MAQVIAFAGSNSKNSINKQLATYAGQLLSDVSVNVLDLNDFELPIYSMDIETADGIPEPATQFFNLIQKSDGIILSLAEHNGGFAAVFKNIFDWMSRINTKLFVGKPMLLMATSPGGRGGASVLSMAEAHFPYYDAKVIEIFSLPAFGANFSEGKITNVDLNTELQTKVKAFQTAL